MWIGKRSLMRLTKSIQSRRSQIKLSSALDRLKIGIVSIFLVSLVGIFGYMVIEGWSVFDALYMTIITISTVGFGETKELSPTGRIFTIVLIVFGLGVVGYITGMFASFIVEGELRNALKGQQMDRLIAKLKNHIIVCGCGRTGNEVIEELDRSKEKFLVIEKELERLNLLPESILLLQGDATDEKVLIQANVEEAKGLITTLPSDADNVFVTLTARGLNPDIKIVSKAAEESSGQKLLRAGADKVILPAHIGGRRMASILLRPDVVDFLDVMMHGEDITLRLEQVTIPEYSAMVGKSIIECRIREQTGAMVIGLRHKKETVQISPPANKPLQVNDTLIVLGREDTLDRLKELVNKK